MWGQFLCQTCSSNAKAGLQGSTMPTVSLSPSGMVLDSRELGQEGRVWSAVRRRKLLEDFGSTGRDEGIRHGIGIPSVL